MMPMSQTMWTHLAALKRDGKRAAYPGLRLNTLDALVARGLALPADRGLGAFSSPQTSIKYKISPNGLKALDAHFGPDNEIHRAIPPSQRPRT